MSRCFSKQQRDAVSLVSDLDASELHADHINPHANGGETTVENCQLISPSVNRSKSDAAYAPREWQQRFQTTWESRTSGNPFLMVAVPGGDKRSRDATTRNNITGEEAVTGTSKAYTLSRLQKESPELFEAVCRKELSANAAAIKAGFRKKPNPEDVCIKAFRKSENRVMAIRSIVKELTGQERELLIEMLSGKDE